MHARVRDGPSLSVQGNYSAIDTDGTKRRERWNQFGDRDSGTTFGHELPRVCRDAGCVNRSFIYAVTRFVRQLFMAGVSPDATCENNAR